MVWGLWLGLQKTPKTELERTKGHRSSLREKHMQSGKKFWEKHMQVG